MTRRSRSLGPLAVSSIGTYQSLGPRNPHRGFTLVEMLIAMAITLVMIGAVVTLFAKFRTASAIAGRWSR